MDSEGITLSEINQTKTNTIYYLYVEFIKLKDIIYEELLDVKKDVILLEKRMEETELAMNDAKGSELEELLNLQIGLMESTYC